MFIKAVKAKKTNSGAKSICVIVGKDDFLVANQCEAILDELLTAKQRGLCLYQPKADEVPVADVLDELRTLPFLADRRVILIKDADKFISANREIQSFFKKSGKSIIALTVKDILNEQIAYKLT